MPEDASALDGAGLIVAYHTSLINNIGDTAL